MATGRPSSRKVVSSAGLGTWATRGAIDFATSATGAGQIARAIKAANGGKLARFYQAVIRTEIIKGATSNESLITARVVQPLTSLSGK